MFKERHRCVCCGTEISRNLFEKYVGLCRYCALQNCAHQRKGRCDSHMRHPMDAGVPDPQIVEEQPWK